jgi:hypothetical protein
LVAPPDLKGIDFGKMDAAELVRTLARLGVQLDVEDVQAAADSVFERLASALRQGVTLAPGAEQSLDKGIDSAFDRALEYTLKSIGGGYRDDILRRVQAEEIWIAVADGNTCDDCISRHAQVQPHAQWQREGLPRSAALQCGRRCRCELLPYRGDKNAPDPFVILEAFL